jgi:hypothetical protein
MRKVCRGRDIEVSFDICFKIQLGPVRLQVDKPMTKAEDPRGAV